jgi:hypothetical protein
MVINAGLTGEDIQQLFTTAVVPQKYPASGWVRGGVENDSTKTLAETL